MFLMCRYQEQIFLLFLKMGSQCIVEAGLKLTILLSFNLLCAKVKDRLYDPGLCPGGVVLYLLWRFGGNVFNVCVILVSPLSKVPILSA